MLRPFGPHLRGAMTLCRRKSGVNCRHLHAGRRSPSLLWLSGHTKDALCDAPPFEGQTDAAVRTASQPPALADAMSSASSSSSSPPLLLDPPFTPVPGEARALRRLRGDGALRYVCGACGSPLFRSVECTSPTAPGRHSGGWPSFTAPASASVLRLRVCLQRAAVRGGDGGAALSVSLAARGLRPEGGMVRQTRSGHCALKKKRTWREECLRDENKRSDPTVMEGCCAACGKAVCRVVRERRRGVKYVVNPTAVVAEVAE